MSDSRFYSAIAEQTLLAFIIKDNDVFQEIDGLIHEDYFHNPFAKRIFMMIRKMILANKEVSVLSLTLSLKHGGNFNQSIEDWLVQLHDATTIYGKPLHFVEALKVLHFQRIGSLLIERMAKDLMEPGDREIVKIFDDYSSQLLEFSLSQSSFEPLTHNRDISKSAIDEMEDRQRNPDNYKAVLSGFTEIDDLTQGFQNGNLIVIAARPGVGKTSFGLDIAMNASITCRIPTIFFSLEMTQKDIHNRMICSMTNENFNSLKNGHINDKSAYIAAVNKIILAEMHTRDLTPCSISDIRRFSKKMQREMLKDGQKLGLIVVDYLQLIRSDIKYNNRHEEVGDISQSLKSLAKELNIPIIALAQLNRNSEARADRRPSVADLRESGSIEQDADLIMLLHREEMSNPATPNKGLAEITIGKNRNGPTGRSVIGFNARKSSFTNIFKSKTYEPFNQKNM